MAKETIFIVGDNTIHGIYLNAQLEEGHQYKIFLRAMTGVDGVSFGSRIYVSCKHSLVFKNVVLQELVIVGFSFCCEEHGTYLFFV